MKENQNVEGFVREYGVFNAGAWLVAISEASAMDVFQPTRRGPTGPRTEVGKRRSSRNALKFGILSRTTLLKGESRSEYQSLLDDLWMTWQPEGKFEEILVEKLASIIWRYRRLLVAESAEIRKYSNFLEFDRRRKEHDEAEEISQRREPRSVIDFALEPVGLIWKIQNPDVLERCIELLNELRRCFNDVGFDEEEDVSVLKTIYADWNVIQQICAVVLPFNSNSQGFVL